ncbi:MAG: TIGR02680 family protein [Streptosporangiales bacterium]|nr:TIGR02680 family protein [Streptosporangiales bacterium]
MTITSETPVSRLPRHLHRYRLSRAGIRNVWQYDDQEFLFGGGRLLLRGKNGAGKSKALEVLLPYLLDGDARRIDAAGSGRTTLKWLMLDGWTGTNKLGYLWAEFVRDTEDGTIERVTVGAAIKASSSAGTAKATYFVTPLSVGDGLDLVSDGQPLSLDALRAAVGPANCFESAADYRARVARDLFGLTDLGRYRNLVHLLYRLRLPTIGDRIESGELTGVLGEALPPVDDDVISEVARNLDDLDNVREELGRLERTDASLTTFLGAYRGYLRGRLRERVAAVRAELEELRARRREAGNAERELGAATEREKATHDRYETLRDEEESADAGLRALRDSAAYRSLEDLRERRSTVAALAGATQAAWGAAGLAWTAEREAAQRIEADRTRIGEALTRMLGEHREALRDARECGVGDTHLGRVPEAADVVLAPADTRTLTGPDGDTREERIPPLRTVDVPAARKALRAWRTVLDDAGTVVKGRGRAAKSLLDLLGRVADAESTALRREDEAERSQGSAEDAATRRAERAVELVAASDGYAAQVGAWAGTVPEADLGDVRALVAPADSELPAERRALPRETGDEVASAARAAIDPVSQRLNDQRDQARDEAGAIAARRRTLAEERARIEAQADPEPPRSPYATAALERDPAAPFFTLIDFAPHLTPAQRAGLEAALEASGLLAGRVTAEGVVLDPGTADVLVHPREPVAGPSLRDALIPVDAPGLPAARIELVLASIALGPAEAPAWAAYDGRWRLGVAEGAYAKPEAEYVGAAVRAETRRRRIAELTERITEADRELEAARARLTAIEERIAALREALRSLPKPQELTTAWTRLDESDAELSRRQREAAQAADHARRARADAVALRHKAEAEAGAADLPADREALTLLHGRLDRLAAAIRSLDGAAGRLDTELTRLTGGHDAWRQAEDRRRDAKAEYLEQARVLRTAREELSHLEAAVGASERQILQQEEEFGTLLREAQRQLPAARGAERDARDARVTAEERRKTAQRALGDQEERTIDGGLQLREPLATPGLPLAAGLDGLEELLGAYDSAAGSPARDRIDALRRLADGTEVRIGEARDDVGEVAIVRRYEDMRDSLSGGYDAALSEEHGIKRFSLHDDTGAHDIAEVGRRIRRNAEDARDKLAVREQETFERFLLGELGDHLSRQVVAARQLVDSMNDTLREVRTSHGLGARLAWRLREDADADLRAAVGLLAKPSAMRTRQESERLRDALRRRIEDERRTDPTAGYAPHLRKALDYRSWHEFTVYVTDAANPERERKLSRRTAMSQGEQRVMAYLVLFAAAASHFSSLGRQAPHAPRLILLDDAFAKVDEPTHGRLLGLLVDLDLDFILTSERLWGTFATVPSLHIYECLRDPAQRGVATLHYRWDGRRKHLVGV